MKTAKTTGLGFILVLLVCFTVICTCTKQGTSTNTIVTIRELDAETERRILQAVADKIADEADEYEITADELSNDLSKLRIQQHIFVNDCIVVSIEGFGGPAAPSTVIVAGVMFTSPQGAGYIPIFVWRDGSLYELQEAYDLGILPTKETFAGLSAETEDLIKRAYLDTYLKPVLPSYFDPDNLRIKIFRHTVADGCDLVSIFGGLSNEVYRPFTPVDIGTPVKIGGMSLFDIGGVLFDTRLPILVWKDGNLYELLDAYDLGYLPTFAGLSAETEKRILQAYLDTYLTPVLQTYLDTHRDLVLPSYADPDNIRIDIARHTVVDGCDVVSIFDNYGFYIYRPYKRIDIGGVLMDTRFTFVWKDDNLYYLQDAFDLGFLQKKDQEFLSSNYTN
jgi:hypothetical protein